MTDVRLRARTLPIFSVTSTGTGMFFRLGTNLMTIYHVFGTIWSMLGHTECLTIVSVSY